MAPIGDVDGDGVTDFLIGSSQSPVNGPRSGQIDCYSGRTLQLIFRVAGRAYEELGTACAVLGDVNGDGIPDFAVGAPGAHGSNPRCGRVDVISGSALRLRADSSEVSLTRGGAQSLTLDLGLAQANTFYMLLGTQSGNQPGTRFQGIDVPLNIDAYTGMTFAAANGPILQNTLGNLDAQGRAQCTIRLPALPGLSGLVVQHAAVWFDNGMNLRGATGTVPLRMVP